MSNTPSIADAEISRLAEVAIRESNNGEYAVTDWQSAALKVCRAALSAAQEQSADALDAKRSQWLAERERWASVCVDFDGTGTYKRHRVVWYNDNGWNEVEGQSFEEAIDEAIEAQEASK